MLIDINVLLYLADANSPFHLLARRWLAAAAADGARLGLPWHCILGFLRLSTNPRLNDSPLSVDSAWRVVDAWLAHPLVFVPQPTNRHAQVLQQLMRQHGIPGARVADAHLAALAVEHNLTMVSFDRDFGRFAEIQWLDPASEAGA
ncbi:MAG: TA system VapC family ribonuclease toxin [Dehalococcoidia bacterium]